MFSIHLARQSCWLFMSAVVFCLELLTGLDWCIENTAATFWDAYLGIAKITNLDQRSGTSVQNCVFKLDVSACYLHTMQVVHTHNQLLKEPSANLKKINRNLIKWGVQLVQRHGKAIVMYLTASLQNSRWQVLAMRLCWEMLYWKLYQHVFI